jgi:hypothetical protein
VDVKKRSTRVVSAVLAVLLGWVIVGYPVFMLAVVAMVNFSGCFLECFEPDPWAGALATGGAIVLVAGPVLVGWSVLRPGSSAWKYGVGGVAVLAVVGIAGTIYGSL